MGRLSPPILAANTDYHVEDSTVDWAISEINKYQTEGGHKPINAVILDIYTFKAPCSACGLYYYLGRYVGNIAQHTGITNAKVRIWTSNGNIGGAIKLVDDRFYRKYFR